MANPKKLRTVLADDEMHLRMLMKTVMTSMNCEIAGEAKNGQEAVDLYRKEKLNLSLTWKALKNV